MKKNILIVIDEIPKNFGGAERQIYNLVINNIIDNGIQISISTRLNNINEDIYSGFLKNNIKVYDLYENGGGRIKRLLQLKKILKKEKIDIVQSYLSGDNILCSVAKIGTGIKHISGCRSDYGSKNFTRSIPREFMDYVSWLFSNRIISNNNTGAKYISKLLFIRKKKIVVVYNGIIIPKKLEVNEHENIIIGCMGSLYKYKNQKILIKAYTKLDSKAKLLIAGDGIEKMNIINYLNELNIDPKSVLLGKVTDITEFYNSINIFVHPSLREGSPNALLEAMAHKKLCIASDIKENREALGAVPEECFFDPYNSGDLVSKINYWVEKREDAKKIAKINQLRIKSKFSIGRLIKSHNKIYSQL
tara:strand:+ start:1839 stop:2921 length:1083 start_codon:yes stop_codon:yes gene_type:complete